MKVSSNGKEREQEMSEASEKKKEKIPLKMTKNHFLIMALCGVLFLVIAWPIEEKENGSSQISGRTGIGQMTDTQSRKQAQEGKTSFDSSFSFSANISENTTLAYGAYLEDTLEEVLSAMEGAGKVKVMITLESSQETVLQKDVTTERRGTTEVDSVGGSRNTTEISSQEETVYAEENGSGKLPYVQKVNTPKVEGVLVAAQGGDNVHVAKNISEAIQALFGIESHKIKIVKMNT